jgi:sRNA-binding protein
MRQPLEESYRTGKLKAAFRSDSLLARLKGECAMTNRKPRAALLWLRSTWPDLFGKPPKPLAMGIGVEIVAKARDAGLKPYAVGTFLYHWTQSRRYLDALAAKDAVRWGLGGTAVDFASREHQVVALVQLSALKTIRREAAR